MTTRGRSAQRDQVGLITVWRGDLSPDLPTAVLPRVEDQQRGHGWAPLTRELGARVLEGLRNL